MEQTPDLGIPLDPYSTLTMTYTCDGFLELKQDIQKNGQLVPILLREGRVLDGRHRLRACEELGISVLSTELGPISDNEALDLVISNSINKATDMDAARVEAYLMCKAKGMKQKDMPSLFKRLNINYVRKLSYIEKENPEYLQALLRQNSVRLYNREYDKVEDYGTINGIWRTLKGNNALMNKVAEVSKQPTSSRDYKVHIDDVMVNEAAEQDYWELFDLGKSQGVTIHPESLFGRKIIDLINMKYQADEEC